MNKCKHNSFEHEIIHCRACDITAYEYIEFLEKENAKYRAALDALVNGTESDNIILRSLIAKELLKDE